MYWGYRQIFQFSYPFFSFMLRISHKQLADSALACSSVPPVATACPGEYLVAFFPEILTRIMIATLPRRRLAAKSAPLACTALVTLLLTCPAYAQRNASDIPAVTKAIAIEGVRIVQAPGRIIENGTVLIRNGLIEAVGENVTIPYDAERLTPDSMTVYAAFIDGLSTTGVPKPKTQNDLPPVPDRSNPPDDRAGIQPQLDVRTMLSADEKSIGALREIGFGASHVVPEGRMLPGSGAVILNAGNDARDLVLRGDVSMYVQFQGARGMYPGTPMAMTAKFRQLFKEAQRRQKMEQQFTSDPSGRARPEFDEVHYAFFPIIDRDKPVFFYVDDALEIHRALKLQSDLGFSLTLAGLHEGFDAVEELKRANVPLFVTLDLPDKPKWMAKLKRDSIDTILDSYTPESRTATFRDTEAEKRNLEARQLVSRDDYNGVATILHDAGLSFGFATYGAKADDIRANIREMIDRGLPEDAALAALTTDAAANLGLSDALGSIEVGKIANLIVADGPVFGEETHFHYVFVDGQKFFYEKKKKKSEDDDKDLLLGTWTFTAHTPDGEQSGETTFTKEGDSYSGTMSYIEMGMVMDITEIVYHGNSLSFSWNDPDQGVMTVEGTISGESFDGIVVTGGEELVVTGVRESIPEK